MLEYIHYSTLILLLSYSKFTVATQTQICEKHPTTTENTEKTISPENDFSQFLKSSTVWADKSLLVESIMKEKGKKIFLINAPRKWCKTTNLKMLQTFFQILIDTDGKKIPRNKTFAYNYFNHGVIYFKHGKLKKVQPVPLISHHRDLIEKNLGQFPVISINFMGISMDKKLSFLRSHLSEVFKSHSYIFNVIENKNISTDLKTRATKFKKAWLNPDKISDEDVLTSIQTISEFLYIYHGKKVIILVDEYDYTIRCNYFDLYTKISPEKDSYIIDTYRKFADYTFHSNNYLEKAIIMAILPVGAALGIPRVDHVREYNLIDRDEIYIFFGFTTTEVFDLMKYYRIEDTIKDNVTYWYGGYNCRHSPSGHIFSPSVLRFMSTKQFESYIIKSMYAEFLFKLRKYTEFETIMIFFIQGNGYSSEYDKLDVNLNAEDCRLINSLVTNSDPRAFKKKHCDKVLGLLGNMGFITITNAFKKEENGLIQVALGTPNEECRKEIMERIEVQLERLF